MSMPKLPEINQEITCEHALGMILASIAMEELALSRIIDAEGEKIQYILNTLENNCKSPYSINEILKVNQSVTQLLNSIFENQVILKNKMDMALCALAELNPPCPPPCPPHPPCPPPHPPCPPEPKQKCSAVFKASQNCRLWRADSAISWVSETMHGKCAQISPCDKTKIELSGKGRYEVSFAVNVLADYDCTHRITACLQTVKNHRREDICTVYGTTPHENGIVTIAMSGIIIEVNSYNAPVPLLLKLISPETLTVTDSMFSIIQL